MGSIFKYRQSLGFTIVELLIVIVVIGILATITVVGYNGVTASARDKSLISDIENVEAEVTRYSVKHNGALGSAVVWYSGGASNPNITFTPSAGNIIDVVADTTQYCIRAYNPGSTKKTLADAQSKGSSPTACSALSPSAAAVSAS